MTLISYKAKHNLPVSSTDAEGKSKAVFFDNCFKTLQYGMRKYNYIFESKLHLCDSILDRNTSICLNWIVERPDKRQITACGSKVK